MSFTIQPYTEVYKQAILNLITGIQQQEFNVAITAEEQPDLQDIPGYYQTGHGNFWVAVANDVVVGTIALMDIGHRQGALRKMFVHAGYRGKEHGVGQALLNTLLAWAQQQQLAEIYLGTTEKFLAAHRFYEKNNFKQVAATALPAAFPRMAVDVIFYKLELGLRAE
jgi:GNAT superfamily N-acetyltransferase